MSDRQGETGAPILPRQGQVGLLIVVVAIAATVFVTVYLFLFVGAKAAHFADSMVAHTTHAKTSPDGRWSLVIDTFDEGALGGSTTVYLQPKTSGAGAGKTTLYDDDWLADSDVRWLDARTVSIKGWLGMPFVEHAIDTGSPQTTGTATDSSGYVHDEIAVNERTFMLSGLSIVLPDGLTGHLLTRRGTARGQPWQRLVPAAGEPWSVMTLHSLRGWPTKRLASAGRVIGQSARGRVVVRWNPAAHSIVVITRLPVGPIGLVWDRGVSVATAQAARQRAERLWEALSVKGTKLPW